MDAVRRLFGRINWKLYRALLLMGLLPAIYSTVRTFFLGQLGEWSYSIAGQLSWVNLLYEVMDEAIILPLFFFMGSDCGDRKAFANKLRTGLLLSAILYGLFAAVIMLFITPMLQWMAASPEIVAESAAYIRLESVANVFGILYRFVLVALVTIGTSRTVYLLTFARAGLSILLDTLLVSQLPISVKLGVNGVGISNMIVYAVLFLLAVAMIEKNGYDIWSGDRLSFSWISGLAKIGGVSGLESLIRNAAYLLMISRMVNIVGEQGTYWAANSFIWSWLLLPVIQLGELIKQEIATDKEAIRRNRPGYFAVTSVICMLWAALIPLYRPFLRYVLGYSDTDKVYSLIMLLLGFYVLYAFQNVFDATFYGAGRTGYMLFESVVTNTLYYGGMFLAYLYGLWTPTLKGVALMFGCGNAFDTVVSWLAYRHFLKREAV